MVVRIIVLSLLICVSTTGYSQDVLKSFNANGCPSDSVRLVLQDQYVLGKFIVNLGEKEIWGNSYVTHYKDLEQITVRGFYEDLTEDISMYDIGISLATCDRVFKTDSACFDSQVSEDVPIIFDSIDVNFQNLAGFNPNLEYTYVGGESVEYTLGQEDVVVNYTVHLNGYPSANHSHIVSSQLVDVEGGEYCRYDLITLRSCTGNPNTIFTELSGLAGNNNGVGAEYTFEMRQSDVVIEVYDPDLDWKKEILIKYNFPKKIELINEISTSCEGTHIHFIEEDWYRVSIHYGQYDVLDELYYDDLNYYPLGFFSEEPYRILDTMVYGTSFFLDNSIANFNYTLLVESTESNCSDYDGEYVSYDPIDNQIISSFPADLFNVQFVNESFSVDVTIQSWKAYNLLEPDFLGYHIYGYPVLIAEGNSNVIEFENFARKGALEITTVENGLCKRYWKEYDQMQFDSWVKILNDVEVSNDTICGGDVELITAINGQKFIFIDRYGNSTITDTLEYIYDYEPAFARNLVVQLAKFNEPVYNSAGKLFDVGGPYCIGEEVSIGLCTEQIEVEWELTDLDEVDWPYIIVDDVLSFTMPSFGFRIKGNFVNRAGSDESLVDTVEPIVNGFSPSLIQEDELNFCNVIEIGSQDDYIQTSWYINEDLISTADDLIYYITDLENIGAEITVRLEASTSSGCDLYDEVIITYNPSINEADIIEINADLKYCPEDIITLICPDEYKACRWITTSSTIQAETYEAIVSEIIELQAIDEAGCITRQALEYNVLYPNVPLEMCQVSSDLSSGANVLNWESSEYYEMIYIFREESFLGDYQLIDSIAGFSNQYFDVTAMSELRSYRYKVQYRNTCNDYSDLDNTDYHRTISLAASVGVNNVVNLSWNDYEGLDYLQVNILRGTDPFAMESITTLPKGINAFIDAAPLLSEVVYYAIEVQLGETCDIIQDQPLLSNVVQTQIVSSIDDLDNDLDLLMYPNPATSTLSIESPHHITIVNIRDIDGKIVGSYGDQDQYDISDLVSGVYLVMVTTEAGLIVRRVYKE